MILNKVMYQLTRWMTFNRKIVFKEVKIYYESDSAVLAELEDQSVWLPKAEISIQRQNGSVSISAPLRLIKRKFPAQKYKRFSGI